MLTLKQMQNMYTHTQTHGQVLNSDLKPYILSAYTLLEALNSITLHPT